LCSDWNVPMLCRCCRKEVMMMMVTMKKRMVVNLMVVVEMMMMKIATARLLMMMMTMMRRHYWSRNSMRNLSITRQRLPLCKKKVSLVLEQTIRLYNRRL